MIKNLLRDNLTREEIRNILASNSRRPLVPPLDSKPWKVAALNSLALLHANAIRSRATEEVDTFMPPLTDELYSIYPKSGSRWEFESVYFERRRRLGRAAISLLLSVEADPERKQFARSLLSKIGEVLDEPAWAFPAHVAVSRAYSGHAVSLTGQDPFVIDLFGAESANLMGELLNYFGEIISSSMRMRIITRLREQYWENYLGRGGVTEFWWMKSTNNWNAVCHQGVIGSALALLDDEELLADILFRARFCLPVFLSGFGPDGGSSEGPGYWDYGFGWFSVLNEQLENRTNGQLSLFSDDAHVHEIARFGPRGSLSGGHLISFSDSNPIGILRPSTLQYLGERLNDELCREQSLINYKLKLSEPPDLDSQRHDLFFTGRFFLRCPAELGYSCQPRADKNIFLPDLGVMIASGFDQKGHLWEIAAKAGHNDEHHNHNDCGSYTVNIDGNRFITEIGQPLYDHDFFSDKRYQNLAARTLGHSLPVINGYEQATGRIYEAKVVEYANSAEETRFVVDLTACYPNEAGCLQLLRTMIFKKALGRLAVRDEFGLAEVRSAESAIITAQPITLEQGDASLLINQLRLSFEWDSDTMMIGVEDHPYRHHDPKITEKVILKRTVLRPASLSSRFSLGFVAYLG